MPMTRPPTEQEGKPARTANDTALNRKTAWLRPELVFPALLAIFGTVFALSMPPFQVADEPSHFFRAYQVSDGRLTPQMVGEWGGGAIPSSLLRLVDAYVPLMFHPERQVVGEPLHEFLNVPLNPEQTEPTPFRGSCFYSFVPYVPQASAIAAARALGCGPLGVFYAGRLGNLALAVLLLYFAIRTAPFFKVVLGAVALGPITVHQLASNSADGSTLAVAFLLIAFFFRLLVQPLATLRAAALLYALAAWLTLSKFPYAALTLLYVGVPPSRLGGWRRYLLVGAGLFLLMLGLTGALAQLKQYAPDRLTPADRGVSIAHQVRRLRAHPERFVLIYGATVAEVGPTMLTQQGQLGWLDTPVNPLAMQAYFFLLLVVGLGDRVIGWSPPRAAHAAALAAAVACSMAIVGANYIAGASIGAKLVPAIQGRYFVPLLPFLLLPLYNKAATLRIDRRVLLGLTSGGGAAILLVATMGLVRRYYLPPEWQLYTGPLSLGVGLVVVVVSTWAASRLPLADGPGEDLRVARKDPTRSPTEPALATAA